jgi:hypothetical protein
VAVLVAVHLDLLYQELHQLAALFERFASVLFDLLDALSERQEPRLGGLCRQFVLFFATAISASTEAIRSLRFSTWFLRSTRWTSSSYSSRCPWA